MPPAAEQQPPTTQPLALMRIIIVSEREAFGGYADDNNIVGSCCQDACCCGTGLKLRRNSPSSVVIFAILACHISTRIYTRVSSCKCYKNHSIWSLVQFTCFAKTILCHLDSSINLDVCGSRLALTCAFSHARPQWGPLRSSSFTSPDIFGPNAHQTLPSGELHRCECLCHQPWINWVLHRANSCHSCLFVDSILFFCAIILQVLVLFCVSHPRHFFQHNLERLDKVVIFVLYKPLPSFTKVG